MNTNPSPHLTYQLDIRDDRISAKQVIVTFTLENASPADVWVLKWYTPLEGIKGKIFTVTCNGVAIPYEGRMVKRAAPVRDDYILIKSGKSVSRANDLATAFTFPESGTCTVTFKGVLHDVATSDKEVPRDPEHHQAMTIPGKPLTFELVPDPAA